MSKCFAFYQPRFYHFLNHSMIFIGNSYQNHHGLECSRPIYLSDGRCNSLSAAGVLAVITGHGPTPPVGSTHHYRQRQPQAIIVPTREARPCLIIRRLLIHVLVVSLK
ncbi:hypothetical protein AVEN_135602-1 [Araneus ventricosus]|uniref:Uncharacterized protein n=1 Tax=Araneus ventricosus TaxID=182803 RepID=A0A4Y2DU41_ARAVE|nr:hypothetical protein AVEN_135602-1 [Araneus ventricosus]